MKKLITALETFKFLDWTALAVIFLLAVNAILLSVIGSYVSKLDTEPHSLLCYPVGPYDIKCDPIPVP